MVSYDFLNAKIWESYHSRKSSACDLEILLQGIRIRIINSLKSLERCDILCHNLSEKELITKLMRL